MGKITPPIFQVKLSNCGLNKANATYGIVKDKSAIKLIRYATIRIAKDTVGKEHLHACLYWVALSFLKETHKRFDELFPEYANGKLQDIIDQEMTLE